MSVEKTNLAEQWEKIWQSDYGKPKERVLKARVKVANLESHGLSFCPGMQVLDAGCGDGSTLGLLRKNFGVTPFGIDISSTALARAEQYNRENNLGMTLKEADVREIPFPDNSFDTVLSFGVIEHFPDYGRALDEFQRVLKPEGSLVLIQPHKYSLRHLKRLWLTLKDEWQYGQQINFSAGALQQALSSHGFGDIIFFVEPYPARGLINTLDYDLHKMFKNWGYYLYMYGKKAPNESAFQSLY